MMILAALAGYSAGAAIYTPVGRGIRAALGGWGGWLL